MFDSSIRIDLIGGSAATLTGWWADAFGKMMAPWKGTFGIWEVDEWNSVSLSGNGMLINYLYKIQ